MTQEDKKLLLIDLCVRLPYKICARQYYSIFEDDFIIEGIIGEQIYARYNSRISMVYPVEKIKPYLRPMSSMTEEERIEYRQKQTNYEFGYFDTYDSIDWLNAHHFDYRHLIENGLALEAPEGMYN